MPSLTRSISQIVILTLIVVSTTVLAVFGAIEYRNARQVYFQQLRTNAEIVAEQLALSLTLPLWNVENEQAFKIMDSALHNREISAVILSSPDMPGGGAIRIRDAAGAPVAGSATPTGEDFFTAQREIVYNGKSLGRVQASFTTRYVKKELRSLLRSLGINILAVNACLVSILYLVLNRLVARPLKAVETYARAQSAGAVDTPRIPGGGFVAELENLRISIETMVGELQNRYADLHRSQVALSQAEERYRAIFENALTGIFQSSPEGRFLTANPAMATLLGYGAPEELVQEVRDIGEQVYTSLEEREALMRVLMERGEVAGRLLQFKRRDGERRWARMNVRVVRDEQGRLQCYEGMIEDVTDGKRAEEELAAMTKGLELAVAERTADLARKAEELEGVNQRLRELDEIKSAFLSSVSHELRTPMTSVLGFAKLILKDFKTVFQPLVKGKPQLEKKGERIQENLRIIGKEGERLTRLINDVLDLAKIESGRVFWQDQPVRPEALISRAVGAIRGQFDLSPHVALQVEVAANLPTLNVDPDRMEQVLINLLHNAIKFTSEGSVTVETDMDSAGWTRMRVRDTGPGVPTAELERIFDKFHQADQSGAGGKPRGTGLGLTLCKQIVEHYGGRIWATSEPGKGSVFTFILPPSAQSEKSPQPAELAVTPSEYKPGRPLLLVVDDDPAVLSYLCQLLDSNDFNVIAASDGASAIEAARSRRPDLITMDILMPGMDGATAIKLMRRDPELSKIPILVITVKEGYTGDADAALIKPVDEESLLDALQVLLGRKSVASPVIVLQPNGADALGKAFALDESVLLRCSVEDMWAKVDAGFQGTVILPPWATQEVELERLVACKGVRVLIMPEQSGQA
jgi:PAS domain S-box-containing protein